MLVDEVLSQIGAVESSFAGLYQWYSEILAADPEVACVFLRLSEEEKKHAELVAYSRLLVRSDTASSPEIEIDAAWINPILETVSTLRNSADPPVVEEAIQKALWLEMRTAEDHSKGRISLKRKHPILDRLLKALASEDKLHFARVMDLARRRGILVPASAGSVVW
jgi:hypothetical protein